MGDKHPYRSFCLVLFEARYTMSGYCTAAYGSFNSARPISSLSLVAFAFSSANTVRTVHTQVHIIQGKMVFLKNNFLRRKQSQELTDRTTFDIQVRQSVQLAIKAAVTTTIRL